MDGAIEPHGWVYGVSCLSIPPRHPTECQLLLSLAQWLLQVQGAALPKNTHKKTAGRGLLFRCNGAPGEIRTPDRLVRSQVLYPTELRAPCDRSGIMRMSARVVNAFVKIFTQLNEKRLCDSLRVFHPREVIGLRTQLLRRKHA